jgi:Tol biopolymer transport system component
MKRMKYQIIFLLLVLQITSFSVIRSQSKYEKLISNEDSGCISPAWSPDGQMIAFTSANYKGIWVINVENKDVKQITGEASAGFGFQWSDDSRAILTRVAKFEGMKRYNAVKLFNVQTGESNQLTEYKTMMPGLPAFIPGDEKVFMYGRNNLEVFNSGLSPNVYKRSSLSSKIVYLKNDKIAVEDLSSKNVEIYEPVKGERVLNLEVSPDRNFVVFEIIGGDMYVMRTDGTGLVDLGKGNRPKWSPDSREVVYIITKDDGYQILASDIYTVRIDGTGKKNVTNTDDKIEMDPDWSPDGKKIAFDIPNEGAIYIMKAP